MKVPPLLIVGAGAAVVVLGAAWIAGRRLVDTVQAVAPKVTPSSPENVIYRDIIGGTGRVLAQDESWSLGGWLASVTGADQDARIREMLRGAPPAPQNTPAGYGELYL